jgi:uroporphyrinogen decarboxylase
MLKNDRLIRALKRQSVDKTPVWLMRQAGRYLPEYRKIRSSVSGFLELCQTPELACEVTLQPLERFDLDAAILFSDILILPRAMGMDLSFAAGEGPVFAERLKSLKDIRALKDVSSFEDMPYTMETIKLIQKDLAGKVPLIGFAGSPWTVATYMVEGGSSKNFSNIKCMLYKNPEMLHELLQKIAIGTVDMLKAQIKSGVQVAMLFDTWGGVLTRRAYTIWILLLKN